MSTVETFHNFHSGMLFLFVWFLSSRVFHKNTIILTTNFLVFMMLRYRLCNNAWQCWNGVCQCGNGVSQGVLLSAKSESVYYRRRSVSQSQVIAYLVWVPMGGGSTSDFSKLLPFLPHESFWKFLGDMSINSYQSTLPKNLFFMYWWPEVSLMTA